MSELSDAMGTASGQRSSAASLDGLSLDDFDGMSFSSAGDDALMRQGSGGSGSGGSRTHAAARAAVGQQRVSGGRRQRLDSGSSLGGGGASEHRSSGGSLMFDPDTYAMLPAPSQSSMASSGSDDDGTRPISRRILEPWIVSTREKSCRRLLLKRLDLL